MHIIDFAHPYAVVITVRRGDEFKQSSVVVEDTGIVFLAGSGRVKCWMTGSTGPHHWDHEGMISGNLSEEISERIL